MVNLAARLIIIEESSRGSYSPLLFFFCLPKPDYPPELCLEVEYGS